ncbi:MAG: hypothetical protein HRU13_08880 [Phycisphaerales bacterium]|nr:hypothetical protein [Phycisphaerales bacterium]
MVVGFEVASESGRKATSGLVVSAWMIVLVLGCPWFAGTTRAQEPWLEFGRHHWGVRLHSETRSVLGAPFPQQLQIWYPATAEGTETPVATDGAPYPVIFFQHAGGSDYTFYDYQFSRLASRGMIVVSMRHDHVPCSVDCHRDLFSVTMDQVFQEWNTDQGHWLYQRADVDRIGLSGHSHGAAFNAVLDHRPMNPSGDYEIDAVSLIAPCPHVPISAYGDTFDGMPPLQLIYGSKDECGCTGTGQGIAIFEPAQKPRHYVYVIGASHWSFCEGGSVGHATIPREDAWRASAAALAAFHEHLFFGNDDALPYLRNEQPLVMGSPEVRYQFQERTDLAIDTFEDTNGMAFEHGVAISGVPGQTFVNGFLGDTFVDVEAGVQLVRNQIRELLPPGSGPYNVLFYKDNSLATDVYDLAVTREAAAGLFNTLRTTSVDAAFEILLRSGQWDLVISARQDGSRSAAALFDNELRDFVCSGGKAILADFRIDSSSAEATFACADSGFDRSTNWSMLRSTSGLFEGTLMLRNPGWGIWTYGLEPGDESVVYAENELTTASGEHDPTTSTLGFDVVSEGMETFREAFMLDPAKGLYHPTWALEFAWLGAGASFTHMLTEAGGPGFDARGWADLTFRILQVHNDPLNPEGGTKDLTIRLADLDGNVADLRLSDAVQGALRSSVAPAATVDRKSIFETYRFALADVEAANPQLDLEALESISFVCNGTIAGRCFLDDLSLAVPASGCPADLDGDGALTFFDFLAFQNLFDAGDPIADFDGDGAFTIFDFLAFQNAFDAGCP